MKTNFLALVTLAISVLFIGCGGANNTPCPNGQTSMNGTCVGNGLNNGLNGINNGWNQGGWNQGGVNNGWNQGGWNQGGWNQGNWNQGGWNQGGIGSVCLSLYNSGCPSGYVFAPNYNNCVPVVSNTWGGGNIYAQGWGAQVGINYQYQQQQVSTPYGIFPTGPCIQWCGPGYAYIQGSCYR